MSAATRPALSPYELRREGWKALTERLGVSGAMRFLMQYDPGHGDYTLERRDLFAGTTVDQAVEEIRRHDEDARGTGGRR
jgi:hypothetical protein